MAAIASRSMLGRGFDLLEVNLEDCGAGGAVGPVERDLPVEAAGAGQGRVQDFGAVRRREQHDALARIEPVEFGEELIERLLFLVIAAAHDACGARAAEAIQLVDEDDARLHLARLLEQVADARRADADEHLHEFGAGDREERHARLARHRARQQRLADAGRADEQNALRHARAKPAVALRVLQEVHDLLQLALGLVGARHIVEVDAGFRLDIDFGARLRPTLIRPPMPCFSAICRKKKAQMAKKIAIGSTQDRMSRNRFSPVLPV